MSELDLPAAVQELINHHLASFDHVEVLLQLHGAEPNGCTLDELMAAIRVAPVTIRACLADLETSGFVSHSVSDARYHYAPPTDVDRTSTDLLAQTYRQRPVTLVRAIYARPVRNVQRIGSAAPLKSPRDE